MAWMGINAAMQSLGIDQTPPENVDARLTQNKDVNYRGIEYHVR